MKQKASVRQKRHALGIRAQLMLFLSFICLFLLTLFWALISHFLEPMYNQHIQTNLTAQADSLVRLLDDAIESGTVVSSRDFGVLVVNDELKQELYDNLNSSPLTNFCVDISDRTMRSVFTSGTLYPCLLHNTELSDENDTSRNAPTVIRMRSLCRMEGSLDTVLAMSSNNTQVVVGRLTSDGSYTVLVTASRVHVAEAVQILGDILPWIAAVVFLFALAAAWLFSQWFTKPLRQLSGAARQMAQGNYDIAVDVRRNDELGTLAQDFTHMAKEVKRAAQLQRDLLANVSHDLRTPLTLIKGYAETVRDLTGDNKDRRNEQMNIIVDETDRLSALVNSVMELSKVSSGTEACNPVRFDMVQLCEEVSERYEAVCAQNGWQLVLDLPQNESLNVWADPAMMERVLHNLLGNAMHHIGTDGVFILRAYACPDGCRVEVEDHGAGIPADDLPYIFDRYYRSRSDSGKVGTGLGLSITKAIFQQHGFRFGVDSTVGKGTTFWFIMTDKADDGTQKAE